MRKVDSLLIPELIQDGPMRVNAYTVSSFFFVTGSALGYVSPLIVSAFKGAGMETLSAWRTTFGIYTFIGIVLLLIPAYTIMPRRCRSFFLRERTQDIFRTFPTR